MASQGHSGAAADQITADLNAVVAYVSKLPSCNGKVIVAGFCWGGGQSFSLCNQQQGPQGRPRFYGTPRRRMRRSRALPVPSTGLRRQRRPREFDDSRRDRADEKAGKTYEPVVYDGAGHGFMRAGEAPRPRPHGHRRRGGRQKTQADFEKASVNYPPTRRRAMHHGSAGWIC